MCFTVCQIQSEVSDVPHEDQKVSQDDPVMKTIKITDDKMDENLGLYVNESSIPAVRQGEETLQKMCIQNAGNESFDKAHVSIIYVSNLEADCYFNELELMKFR